MIQALLDFDKWLFLILNGLHNSSFDVIMSAFSNKLFWIPFYAGLLIMLVKKFKIQSLYIIVLVALMITLCDQFSVHFFKNVFMRLRPCHEPDLQALVHLVSNHCGGQFGFVSSHAANVFGLAFFLGRVFKQFSKYWMPILLAWAVVVSYSRIYLGVHYPFDIICGAFLGFLIARFMLVLLKTLSKRYELKIFEI